MVQSCVWTASRARLQLNKSSEGKDFNWLFLPGGLGAESLLPLIAILNLPGNLWLLDLPGDGSNMTSNNAESFSKWPVALVEAVSRLRKLDTFRGLKIQQKLLKH